MVMPGAQAVTESVDGAPCMPSWAMVGCSLQAG
jgi:hypothetical protein